MNRIITCLLLLLLFSCAKNEEAPSFGADEVVFTGNAVNESQTVRVRVAGEWSIDESALPEWLSVSPLSGFDNGDVTFTVLSVNDTQGDRTCEVVLNASGFGPVTIVVKQLFATDDQLTDGMLSKSAEGFYEKGEPSFVFDPATMQVGLNLMSKNYFLISDDQKQILSLTFGAVPQINQPTYIFTQSRGLSAELSGTVECKLYKQQDGKMWFYNAAQKKGFIIREIK